MEITTAKYLANKAERINIRQNGNPIQFALSYIQGAIDRFSLGYHHHGEFQDPIDSGIQKLLRPAMFESLLTSLQKQELIETEHKQLREEMRKETNNNQMCLSQIIQIVENLKLNEGISFIISTNKGNYTGNVVNRGLNDDGVTEFEVLTVENGNKSYQYNSLDAILINPNQFFYKIHFEGLEGYTTVNVNYTPVNDLSVADLLDNHENLGGILL